VNALKAKPSSPKKAKLKSKSLAPAYLVGIGASAGGLEALRTLFGAVKHANDMAFVVVQHLAPLYQSRLVELIAHSTSLSVREIRENERPMSGVIYITPPNKDVVMERGMLRLRRPHLKIGPKPSVDLFFQTLAEDRGERAIGIILSGTGSDGSLGIRAIKAAGGMTISQRVSSAKYDGMPKAAKLTGAVDMELTPEQIARELERFKGVRKALDRERASPLPEDPFREILAMVQRESGTDFAQYKPATIRRRIERRIIATHSDSIESYLALLAKQPQEAAALYQDILISVTSFFRDREAFKALERRLLAYLREKRDGSPFRCWVVGCATGEEAYSIAMLVTDIGAKLKKSFALQIFATDLDEQALGVARKGIYSKASLQDLTPGLLERHFKIVEDRYQVHAKLRDAVVFARHNVNQDPPFLNIDLVTCRNVLIYFGADLQDQVFRTLHYALAKGGILFLGKSESVSAIADFFEVDSKPARIFTKLNRRGELPRGLSAQGRNGARAEREAPAARKPAEGTVAHDLYTSMIASFAPDSVVVTEENQVRHIHGQAGQYLSIVSGDPTHNITKLLPPELSLELAILMQKARRDRQFLVGREHELRGDGSTRLVRMSVAPLISDHRKDVLVRFESRVEAAAAPDADPSADLTLKERLERTERDLSATQNHLQTILEEQDTTGEELQSLNEELQSSNEELQSSNEELETANEEMQSANEELTTLNQELNVKSAELQSINQTLQAIQNAIIYPLIVVDRHLKIVSFNPAARYLLRINENDVGHSLKAVPTHIELNRVVAKLEKAIVGGAETSFQLKEADRSFEVQLQLFRGAKDVVQGAVISFVDNSEIMSALDSARLIKSRLSDIMDNTPAMVTMKDTMGVYTYANRRFSELVDVRPEDVLGRTDDELLGSEQSAQLRERDFEVAKIRKAVQSEEKILVAGRQHWWASARFPLLDPKNRVQSVCTISLDITEGVQHRRQLELFKQAVSSATGGIMLLEEAGEDDFRATLVSEELGETLGTPADGLRGKTLRSVLKRLLPVKRGGQIDEVLKQIRSRDAYSVTLGPIALQGAERWIELRSQRLRFKEEAGAHLVITLFDVTQRELDQRTITQQHDELARFSRFSALGEIAAGIAHEINTPLNVVTAKTDFLKKLVALGRIDGEKVVKTAADIDQMAKNISSIVIGLKSLASSESDNYELANVCQIVRDTLKVCEFRLHRFGVDLRLSLPETDVFVECYPVQLSQIIINLINNSVDAISEKQDRWIAVELLDVDPEIRLSVTDCGDGIAPEVAEKIMTPFFTTKREHGTGIGLSLSRTIARRHGGDLALDLHNRHTAFELVLPKRRESTL
jgi:two-component system CheB/CheR fusion protein